MKGREGQRPVSIKDIARAVGVSHPTVSRALHGSPLVAPETAAQIRKTAEEMGYKASLVARSLVTRKTQTIGLVVTTIADPFYGEIVSGAEEVAAAKGYSVILANCQIDPEREVRVVRSLQERRVDGILVAASRVGGLYLSLMSEMGVPIVLINNQHDGEFMYSVSIDDMGGARKATNHLIELGHQRIAYLGDPFGCQTDVHRFEGYKVALAHAGVPIRPEFVVEADGLPSGGLAATHKLLSLAEPPTAIFCYNDMTLLGALRAAAERGLSVPRDVSLVGFDDLFFAPYIQPPITTLRQPKREMGRRAIELLFALLNDEQSEKKIQVEGELVIRSSTAPPRA
ncbi:MAG: LacI family DNA-binding transcriptional regulator [Bryobacteraceae bacterium]